MNANSFQIHAQPVVDGDGQGEILVLDAPLSFWGGLNAALGQIVEQGHPQENEVIAGRMLFLNMAKGSSSSSSVLTEAIRNGTGPTGIIMGRPDLIVALGSIVASELYGQSVPIACVDSATWHSLTTRVKTSRIRLTVQADVAVIEIL